MSNNIPDTLYHYCSLDTFLKIIKNKAIWLSDILKSNDSDEIIWAKRILNNRIRIIINEYIGKNPNCDVKAVLELGELCYRSNFRKMTRFWTFCVSEESDLLSQWRGYADDGCGVSIGFNKNLFESLNMLPQFGIKKDNSVLFFDKVNYSIQSLEEWFLEERIFDDCYRARNLDELKNALFKAISRVESQGIYFKNDAFGEEKEWRLVLSVVDYCNTIKSFSELNSPNIEFSDVDYLVIRNQLVSHVEIKIETLKEHISEIVIGPKCHDSLFDINCMLCRYGFLNDINDKSIKITRSKASYR